jgi:transcriptional antiterminator NusG
MSEHQEPQWYVVHTYSGYENKVKANLEKSVENNGMQDLIFEVKIPIEEAVEIKNNKRKTVQRKLLPGYVMVRMIMTNESWYMVRNTRGVTGFVGPGSRPTPLSETDFDAIGENRAPPDRHSAGDEVRILTGLFENLPAAWCTRTPGPEGRVVGAHAQARTAVDLEFVDVVRGNKDAAGATKRAGARAAGWNALNTRAPRGLQSGGAPRGCSVHPHYVRRNPHGQESNSIDQAAGQRGMATPAPRSDRRWAARVNIPGFCKSFKTARHAGRPVQPVVSPCIRIAPSPSYPDAAARC